MNQHKLIIKLRNKWKIYIAQTNFFKSSNNLIDDPDRVRIAIVLIGWNFINIAVKNVTTRLLCVFSIMRWPSPETLLPSLLLAESRQRHSHYTPSSPQNAVSGVAHFPLYYMCKCKCKCKRRLYGYLCIFMCIFFKSTRQTHTGILDTFFTFIYSLYIFQ